MPIQLIITGDHMTDVFAEIQNFASAIGGVPSSMDSPVRMPVREPLCGSVTQKAQSEPSTSKFSLRVDGKLHREEQDAAVEEMIKAGVKDERFDLLTKGRQKAVEDGIANMNQAPVTAQESEPSEETIDMFEKAAPEVVTTDTLRQIMGKLGKDEHGEPIQDNLIKIRNILTNYVPDGSEVKVGNIPPGQLAQVYAEMKALEG